MTSFQASELCRRLDHAASAFARGAIGLVLGVAAMGAMAQALEPQSAASAPSSASSTATASTTAPRLARDMRESFTRIPVTVKDLYGRAETRDVIVTIFRPPGDTPAPLAVINHGRSGDAQKRADFGRARFEHQARYLVSKGFVVIAPTRIGYGETAGNFDPEDRGGCQMPRPEAQSVAASDQVLAVVDYAKSLPYVDTSRWIVLGTSVGGLTAIATVARNPAGLVGGINFAGGTGGDPERTPGRPCGARQQGRLWETYGAQAKAPMLWLYWENDQYWGKEVPKSWHQAWTAGGAKAEFLQLPACCGKDGHVGLTADMDHWVPHVERFLAELGFTQSGAVARPAATDSAPLEQAPKGSASRQDLYQKFLKQPKPRAFAIGPKASGYASGDWAMGRALGFCQAVNGEVCRLYAVDDDVVWSAQTP